MTLESTLQDADVANIWAPEAEYTLVALPRAIPCALEPSGKPYALLTLTDGVHKADALAFPKSNLAQAVVPGQRVRLLRHRVQWTNGRRQWFIFEGSLLGTGEAPPPDAAALAPVPHPEPVLPAATRPRKTTKKKRKISELSPQHAGGAPSHASSSPFILGPGAAPAPAPARAHPFSL